jgi:queuine tRNA-ribosyltransferase
MMAAEKIWTMTAADTSCGARTGVLSLPHGTVRTPVFMPVGTNGTVKAVTKDSLIEIGFEIILANTYHLYLRPGPELIAEAGSLHDFCRWPRNILTDSGGFQVFSLAPFRKITEEGVKFRSHIDGSYHILTPEKVVDIQRILNSDIQMQLDVCTEPNITYQKAEEALNITSAWLRRAKTSWDAARDAGYQGKLFAIVQGNFYRELRQRSVEEVLAADTPGIAIGGLSVGEPPETFNEFLHYTTALLPREKPRYVMGIGTPAYILQAIEEGIDMFDCVLPTRVARNGLALISRGSDGGIASGLVLKKAEYIHDFRPIDETCACPVCRQYSRAYLRHLFKTREILCSMLLSYHNLYYLNDLVLRARVAIEAGRFREFKKEELGERGTDNPLVSSSR